MEVDTEVVVWGGEDWGYGVGVEMMYVERWGLEDTTNIERLLV